MKTYNIFYTNEKSLKTFIEEKNLSLEKSVLVQIFSGILDKDMLKGLASSIKKEIPSAHIAGTTTAGEILSAKMYDEHIVISFSIFETSAIESIFFDFDVESNIDRSLEGFVKQETKALIVFSDGLKSNAEELLNKITLIKKDLVIAGGRAADALEFKQSFVFNDANITENGCVIVSLSGKDLRANSDYILNWNPIGKDMRVTKAHNNQLFEVDEMSIVEVYRKFLGDDIADNLPQSGNEFPLLIQKNKRQIARVPVAKLSDDSLLYGGFIEEGSVVRFSFGDVEYIKNSAQDNFNKFKDIPSQSIFIYSCSARKSLMGVELESELSALESIAPTAGFFTFGEYFHTQNKNELLNVTTTFLALSEVSKTPNKAFVSQKASNQKRILSALTHLAKVTTDELEREKLEAQSALKIKSEFLANMSHEIRTPLNAMLGLIDIVKENEYDRQNLEYLDIIQSSGGHLLSIINDILDFSKIDSKHLEIEYVKIDSIIKFKYLSELFAEKAKEKNIRLNTSIDENLPKCIKIDPVRVSQIISNLLSNAIKFTPKDGDVAFKVSYLKESNSIFISVKDNGIGIKKEKQKDIFEAFMQADSSTTREYGGTGLGLAISYRLVELMGGKLRIKSDFGKGCEFFFSLNLLHCDNCDLDKDLEQKIYEPIKFTKQMILLVEDNRANQMFMKVILKKFNLNFEIAEDGVEAVEKFKAGKFDAILMDENMPNKNGIVAVKEILQYEKENNLTHTPVIALTANAIKGDRERFIKAGMDEYLTKPVDQNMLNELLKKVLKVAK